MNALTSPIDDSLVAVRAETFDELIARVLGRAHRMREALNAPNEARAILEVAHSFADELSTLDPGFDRLRFIKVVTGD